MAASTSSSKLATHKKNPLAFVISVLEDDNGRDFTP